MEGARGGLELVFKVCGGDGDAALNFSEAQRGIVGQVEGAVKGAQAASSHQPQKLLSIIADDYNDGLYTKTDLATLARGGLAPGGRDLRVVPFLKSIQLRGKTATTELEAEITAQPNGGTQRLRITVEWRKGRRGWQVVRAQGWEGAEGMG